MDVIDPLEIHEFAEEKVRRDKRPGQPCRAVGGTPPPEGRGAAQKTQVGRRRESQLDYCPLGSLPRTLNTVPFKSLSRFPMLGC